MPEGRPAIPAALQRAVEEEAGHRCAIPRCGGTSALQLAHIEPWSKVKEHTFENLILLCAVDHIRYDQGEISRISMRNYKRNLGVVNGRYNDFERRLLEWFEEHGLNAVIRLDYSATTELSLRNLVRDGLLGVRTPPQVQTYDAEDGSRTTVLPVAFTDTTLPRMRSSTPRTRVGGYDEYRLSDKGKVLVQKWFDAEPIS